MLTLPFGLLVLLLVKHLICDFFLQGPYQYLNKGRYGHPGGILHAFIAMWGTFLVFIIWLICTELDGRASINGMPTRDLAYWAILIGIEGIVHYHTDWAKVQICRKMEWHANNSEYFWWLLGVDQFIHHLTYVLLALFYA